MSKRNYLIDVPVFPIIFSTTSRGGWIQDFRDGGMAPNARGGNLLFGQFFQKLHENEENWIGRGDSKVLLCKSATDKKKLYF